MDEGAHYRRSVAGHELATSRVRVLSPSNSVENQPVCRLPSLLCAVLTVGDAVKHAIQIQVRPSKDVIHDESCMAWWSVSVWQAASCHVIAAVDTSPARTNIVHGATFFCPPFFALSPFSKWGKTDLGIRNKYVERICCHLLGREHCLFIGPGVSSYICPARKCLQSRAFRCILV
jgi:hypothetical protein